MSLPQDTGWFRQELSRLLGLLLVALLLQQLLTLQLLPSPEQL